MIRALLVIIFVCPVMVMANEVLPVEQQEKVYWELELDPYYTNLGLYIT